MSVKFEKETVKDAPIPGGRRHEIAHEMGERLTGGETAQGYLAVRRTPYRLEQDSRTNGYSSGLSPAASKEPSPNEDAHIWNAISSTRSPCVLDRQRC